LSEKVFKRGSSIIFTLWDEKKEKWVPNRIYNSKDWTPYEGWKGSEKERWALFVIMVKREEQYRRKALKEEPMEEISLDA